MKKALKKRCLLFIRTDLKRIDNRIKQNSSRLGYAYRFCDFPTPGLRQILMSVEVKKQIKDAYNCTQSCAGPNRYVW